MEDTAPPKLLSDAEINQIPSDQKTCPVCLTRREYVNVKHHCKQHHNLETTVQFPGARQQVIAREASNGFFRCPRCRSIYPSTDPFKKHAKICPAAPLADAVATSQYRVPPGPTRSAGAGLPTPTDTITMAKQVYLTIVEGNGAQPVSQYRQVSQESQRPLRVRPIIPSDVSSIPQQPAQSTFNQEEQRYQPPRESRTAHPIATPQYVDLTGEDDGYVSAQSPPLATHSHPQAISPARGSPLPSTSMSTTRVESVRTGKEAVRWEEFELSYPNSDEEDSRFRPPPLPPRQLETSAQTREATLPPQSPTGFTASSRDSPFPLPSPSTYTPLPGSRISASVKREPPPLSPFEGKHYVPSGSPLAMAPPYPIQTTLPHIRTSILMNLDLPQDLQEKLTGPLLQYGIADVQDMDILCSWDPDKQWEELKRWLLNNNKIMTIQWMGLRRAMLMRRIQILSAPRNQAYIRPYTDLDPRHFQGVGDSALQMFLQTLRRPLGEHAKILKRCGIESRQQLDLVCASVSDWPDLKEEFLRYGMSEFGWLLVEDGFERWRITSSSPPE